MMEGTKVKETGIGVLLPQVCTKIKLCVYATIAELFIQIREHPAKSVSSVFYKQYPSPVYRILLNQIFAARPVYRFIPVTFFPFRRKMILPLEKRKPFSKVGVRS